MHHVEGLAAQLAEKLYQVQLQGSFEFEEERGQFCVKNYLIARQTALCQADSSRRSSCLGSYSLLGMLDINDPAFAYFSRKSHIHFVFYSSPCFHTEVMGLLSECLKTKELHQLQQKISCFYSNDFVPYFTRGCKDLQAKVEFYNSISVNA